MTVDGYEKTRPPRKSQFEMIIPREERQEILIHDWKVPQLSIADAVRSNIRAKNQRRRTVNNLGSMLSVVEEVVESAKRKVRRAVRFESRPSRLASQLEREHLAAKRQRDDLWRRAIQQEQERPEYIEKRSIHCNGGYEDEPGAVNFENGSIHSNGHGTEGEEAGDGIVVSILEP